MPPKEETGQAGTGVQHALPASMALKLKGQSGAQQYEAWKVFKFQFENYLVATRQSELSEERKVAILLHVMGVEIVPIYLSFNLSGEKTVSQVIQEFEKYFSPQKNLSLERNVFLSRRQMPGESLEGFITNLKNLSTTCELGSLRESLVRDIFILGLLEENSYIKERLLEEGDKKSLSEIFDLARTLEMSKEKCSKPVLSVSTSSHSRSNSYNKNVKKSKCNRCGYMVQIPHQKCPALRAMCNSCSKVGHYAKMCRVKKVNTVQEISVHSEGQEPECGSKASPNDSFFIGVVNHNNDSPWKVLVKVNNKLLPMSIDTGAEANVMSLSSYKESGLPSFSIQPTCSKLTAYGGTDIPIVGQCIINCEINKEMKPVAFASRSLTETQKRWAQIEKELFAIWFGCVKFHQYIYGLSILVETDHKPLVTLFKKALSDIPNRLQRIMLKLQLYDLHVVYKAGKEMYVSDTLSRAALTDTCQEFDDMLDQELAVHSNMFMRTLNVSDAKLNEICEATKNDNILQQKKPGDIWLPAKISKLPKQINSKRSYEVLTPDGSTYCRNRVYLRKAGKQLDEIATSNEDCGADAYLDPENEYYCHCPAFYDKEQPVESQSSPSTAGLGQDADRQSVECPSTDPGQNINVSQDSDEMLDQTDLILDNRNLLDRTVMLESDDSFVSTDMSYQDDTKNDPDWLP
ncbi:hypothetical protein M8J77_018934 [Diaphorina citri]|nr:hypothetical protein M8J77_018934 [Diaphorina citri]